LTEITAVNDHRNTYIAHVEKELNDAKIAERELKNWARILIKIINMRDL